jgi:predicted RNase H-like HicB family nuclease
VTRYPLPVTLHVEFDREEDGRWIAEIPALPGCLVYAASRDEALKKAEALALRVLADRLEHGEAQPEDVNVSFVVSAAA